MIAPRGVVWVRNNRNCIRRAHRRTKYASIRVQSRTKATALRYALRPVDAREATVMLTNPVHATGIVTQTIFVGLARGYGLDQAQFRSGGVGIRKHNTNRIIEVVRIAVDVDVMDCNSI